MSAKRRNTRAPIIIMICGLAGSGKSTLAKKLAKKYRLKYCSGGNALKALAKDEGYKPLEQGWWESEEGMRFLERRSRDPQFDKLVDKKLLEMAQEGNVALDSWTMPWLLEKGFKVWLEASAEKRAERIASRDGMNFEEALKALKTKETRTRTIYRKLYNFDLGKDFAPFHLILDTETLKAGEVFAVLSAVVENVVLNP